MKPLLIALAFTAVSAFSAQAREFDLSRDACQAAGDSIGQITAQRDQGLGLQDLKNDIERQRARLAHTTDLLQGLADWAYAEPSKSAVEMTARLSNLCSRSAGRSVELPIIPTGAAPDVFECLTIVDMSRHIKRDLVVGRPLEAVLTDIWSEQEDDGSAAAVSAFAELAKQIYTDRQQVPEAHAMRFLKSCLDAANKKTASAR